MSQADTARRPGEERKVRDLHTVQPVYDWGRDPVASAALWSERERSVAAGPADVTCHFGDLRERLVDFIERSEMVVGCVAWLTDPGVLSCIAARDALLVVQKEDFLRPDCDTDQARRLRSFYEKIDCGFERWEFPAPLGHMSTNHDPGWGDSAVRCVGNHNTDKDPAWPRMHHKFLVRVQVEDRDDRYEFVPTAVWTGSFNFTLTGSRSFENAVEIHGRGAGRAYFNEFLRVMSVSEPLDWESKWASPEWRIGS